MGRGNGRDGEQLFEEGRALLCVSARVPQPPHSLARRALRLRALLVQRQRVLLRPKIVAPASFFFRLGSRICFCFRGSGSADGRVGGTVSGRQQHAAAAGRGAGRMACGHVTKEAWRGWALTWSTRVSWRRREVVLLAWAREDSRRSGERIGQAGAGVMDAVGDAFRLSVAGVSGSVQSLGFRV